MYTSILVSARDRPQPKTHPDYHLAQARYDFLASEQPSEKHRKNAVGRASGAL